MIQSIYFFDTIKIGADATPYTYLQQDQVVSGTHKIKIDFDKDERFLLVTATHRDSQASYEQLIPLTAVASILMKEKRVPVSREASDATKG